MIIKTRKDRKIANQKAMIQNRDILIKDLMKIKTELKEENLAVHNENKDLRFENEEQKELIDRISKIATANSYNNEKAILDKIKELVNDYQSNTNSK